MSGGAEAESPDSLEKEEKEGDRDWRDSVRQLREDLGFWTKELRLFSLGSGKSLKVLSRAVTCEDLQSPRTTQAQDG